MATSDSDDFESADEEIEFRDALPKKSSPRWAPNSTIGSDSDDDVCATSVKQNSWSSKINNKKYDNSTAANDTSTVYNFTSNNLAQESKQQTDSDKLQSKFLTEDKQPVCKPEINIQQKESILNNKTNFTENVETKKVIEELNETVKNKCDNTDLLLEKKKKIALAQVETLDDSNKKEGAPTQQKSKGSSKFSSSGVKKLGSKIVLPNIKQTTEEIKSFQVKNKTCEGEKKVYLNKECLELDDDGAIKILERESYWHKSLGKSSSIDEFDKDQIPEELKSNKKFKEVFGIGDWEDLSNQNKITTEFDTDNSQSVANKPATSEEKINSSAVGWGSWGTWGVTSLLNTASAGVSNLTSQVSYGLSVLEDSISTPTSDLEQKQTFDEKSIENTEESMQLMSFGLSDLISGVSSITKLVENTGTKVINGGLGTLETIGKKTMEVLQEGDPGLKKKRAFFMNEKDKPILSHMLREAKEKAEAEQKTYQEKEQARKVHFESLFDDFQGLVHLEALEMLSKQSTMKIQQRLVTLNTDEAKSIQETLDEVKELCDLGDENDDDESNNDNLEERLKSLCADLGVIISFDKLYQLWEEKKKYITNVSQSESSVSDREVFENSISSLAQFTAYCVERFHKTAELILIKDRRSTVNEADALVQLTKILSLQIGVIANLFCKCLNERMQGSDKSNDSVDITTIFLEATNASSYVQEAFQLLIPILQVGAI
ncbi:protein FAM114A2 [Microplitis mediator]|uniref:protein FAM114A2 n=1 Tax=Microplitis mediator TaxID=375433 RepID=UPI002555D11C|nr:protein FAM114A2 [Microplitis mediator]